MTNPRWGKLLAERKDGQRRLSVYHDPLTGPHQFNVVLQRNLREVASGSLAAAIDNSELIADRDGVETLSLAEVNWLIEVQEKFDI